MSAVTRRVVPISSAQLKNLAASPVVLAPAPPRGSAVWPIALVASYTFGSVAYTNTDGNRECAGWAGSTLGKYVYPTTVPFLLGASSAVEPFRLDLEVDVPPAIIDGTAFVFGVDAGGADFAAGDGTLRVTFLYTTVTL